MTKPLTVFLCSTQADLKQEREAVLEAVRRLQLQHDSMEFFGAREGVPLETCLEEVRNSDILVVVVGHRYGTFVPSLDISYSEAEYQEGYRLGKPCLVYMRSDDVPVLPRHVERDPAGVQALEIFKRLLQERHTVANFRSANDLAVGVAADVARTVQAIEETARIQQEQEAKPIAPLIEQVTNIVNNALESGVTDTDILTDLRTLTSKFVSSDKQRGPIVFLSHTQKDKKTVLDFADGLRNQGFEVWLDDEQIAAGQNLLEVISHGLQSADCLALFMSRASMESKWVQQELNIVMASRLSASKKGPLIIPILLEDIELPSLLRDVKYIDLRSQDINLAVEECTLAINHFMSGSIRPKDLGHNFFTIEKSIHALRSLLHIRRASPESENIAGSWKRSLEHSIRDIAKVVGSLCGLSTIPKNRLSHFLTLVSDAKGADDLHQIFNEMPELRQYIIYPYF